MLRLYSLALCCGRWGVLTHAAQSADWDPELTDHNLYQQMQQPILSFVSGPADSGLARERADLVGLLCEQHSALMAQLDGASEPIPPELLKLVVERFVQHHDKVLEINSDLYLNVDRTHEGVMNAMARAAREHHAAVDGLVEFCANGVVRDDPDSMDFYFAYCGF